MARSSVARTFPTLPPSAISASAMTRALDRYADVLEGGGDWRVRLVHGHAHGGNLRKAREHGVSDGARCRFHQSIPAGAECLARDRHHLVVAHGVRKLVRVRGAGQVD